MHPSGRSPGIRALLHTNGLDVVFRDEEIIEKLNNGFPDRFPEFANEHFNVILANPPFKGNLDVDRFFNDYETGQNRNLQEEQKVYENFVQACRKHLSSIIPNGTTIKIIAWKRK